MYCCFRIRVRPKNCKSVERFGFFLVDCQCSASTMVRNEDLKYCVCVQVSPATDCLTRSTGVCGPRAAVRATLPAPPPTPVSGRPAYNSAQVLTIFTSQESAMGICLYNYCTCFFMCTRLY